MKTIEKKCYDVPKVVVFLLPGEDVIHTSGQSWDTENREDVAEVLSGWF